MSIVWGTPWLFVLQVARKPLQEPVEQHRTPPGLTLPAMPLGRNVSTNLFPCPQEQEARRKGAVAAAAAAAANLQVPSCNYFYIDILPPARTSCWYLLLVPSVSTSW